MKILALLIFLSSGSACLARIDSFYVELKNGSIYSYAFAELKEISFAGTSVEIKGYDAVQNIFKSFILKQNYPNPFNPNTTIEYEIPYSGLVEISIYDIQGKLVRSFGNSLQQKGAYSVEWNGHNNSGNPVSSGAYIYRVQFNENFLTKKLLLVR
jgi:flagellar hook assembly protein FlgD